VNDVNTENLYGGRASLLFQPNDDVSVTATALYQRMVLGGYDDFDSPPGSAYLAHYEGFNIPGTDRRHGAHLQLTAVANLGFADLTSASAYWDRQEHQTQDASESATFDNGGIYPVCRRSLIRKSIQQAGQPGNSADLARRRPAALGDRRLLSATLIPCGTSTAPTPSSPRPAIPPASSMSRTTRIHRAIGLVRRRLVQDHRYLEILHGPALVPISKHAVRAGVGL
jgi:hypothetical protein